MIFVADHTSIITGGLGGVGLRVAEHLIRTVRARLVLVGRSQPTAEQREFVAALERLGSEVLVCRADVADHAQMQRVIDEAHQRFGGIQAVVHSAGVSGGGVLALKTPNAVWEEFRAKVQGATVIDALFREQPLELLLFSSNTLMANQYCLPGVRLFTVNVSLCPEAFGVMDPAAVLAEPQLPEVMANVAYLIWYDVAVPVAPSSPTAVHVNVTELVPTVPVARVETSPGAVVSELPGGMT